MLDPYEERHAHKSDPDADQPHARDPLADVDPGREQHCEDRRGRLDHGREPGVEPRLREAEQPERHRVVESAEHDERDEVPVQSCQPAAAAQQRQQHEDTDDEAAEHDHRRLERVDPELDEEERRSPNRREQEQEEGVTAAHGLVEAKRRGAARCEVPAAEAAARMTF